MGEPLSFLKIRFDAAQFRFDPRAVGSGPKRHYPIRKIIGEFGEMGTRLLVESAGPVSVEGEGAERRPFRLERERERGPITTLERLIPPVQKSRIGRNILSRAGLAGSNGDGRRPLCDRGVGRPKLDAVEISVVKSGVRDPPPRRAFFSISDPRHSDSAILHQDSADGVYQVDLLSRANERLVAAIDGSERAIGGPQLLLDAHALRDLSHQPLFRGLVRLQGDASS